MRFGLPSISLAAILLAGCGARAATAPPAPIIAPTPVASVPIEEAASMSSPPAPPRRSARATSPVCVGPLPAPERPPTATCCYPPLEVYRRLIAAALPRMRACVDGRDVAGRIVFDFRIEQDGSVGRACTGASTEIDDEEVLRCAIDVLRAVRFPATSDAERAMCGLVRLSYPIVIAR